MVIFLHVWQDLLYTNSPLQWLSLKLHICWKIANYLQALNFCLRRQKLLSREKYMFYSNFTAKSLLFLCILFMIKMLYIFDLILTSTTGSLHWYPRLLNNIFRFWRWSWEIYREQIVFLQKYCCFGGRIALTRHDVHFTSLWNRLIDFTYVGEIMYYTFNML